MLSNTSVVVTITGQKEKCACQSMINENEKSVEVSADDI